MIYTEVIPYIYITDLKYLKKTNITRGTVLLLTKIKINLDKKVNIIRLPLEYTGRNHEYKENITKNKLSNSNVEVMYLIFSL